LQIFNELNKIRVEREKKFLHFLKKIQSLEGKREGGRGGLESAAIPRPEGERLSYEGAFIRGCRVREKENPKNIMGQ